MPPRPEQQVILDADDRLRLVRAAPGSGKTWLIAEAIRREIIEWKDRHRGVAAISFTNVAGAEIRKKLGFDPGHPHFVGTLDSFLFRYVVRPFARLRNPEMPEPRLVPGVSAACMANSQRWCRDHLEVVLKPGRGEYRRNIFSINFFGGTRQAPLFVTAERTGTLYHLSVNEARETIQKKRRVWQSSGRVSHSDAAYMSSLILTDPNVGPGVVSLLARRFPKIYLDEVQDTGWFLGRAVLRILTDQRINALVVGDPDQAIYEFNGASPQIFDEIAELDGTEPFEIRTSLRCADGICTIARSFSIEGRPFVSDTSRAGNVIMAIHDGEDNLPRELLSAINRSNPEKVHRLITRKNSIVRKLNGSQARTFQGFRSKPIENLHNAVNALRSSRPQEALSLAEASVSRPILGTDTPSDLDLETIGTSAFLWKKTVIKILLRADREEQGETLYQWGCAACENIVTELRDQGWWNLAHNPRAPNRPNQTATQQESRSRWLEQKGGDGQTMALSAATVHSVKGETHDTTVLFVPAPDRFNPCPSEIWWSEEDQHTEERRIAYVATTRAKDSFILCLHRQTFEALQESQPEFVDSMECVELAELVNRYRSL